MPKNHKNFLHQKPVHLPGSGAVITNGVVMPKFGEVEVGVSSLHSVSSSLEYLLITLVVMGSVLWAYVPGIVGFLAVVN